MTENEQELCKILKGNPFLPKIEEWGKKLDELACADLEAIQSNYFILDGDERFLDDKYKKKDTRLYLDLLPQPFIGNPKADIWYLQINPSFSWVDYYDLISTNANLVSNICKGLSKDVGNKVKEEDFKFPTGNQALEMQVKRRAMLLNQFDLSRNTHVFYALDESFHTVEYKKARNSFGTYRWWKKAFCINNENAIFKDVFDGQAPVPEAIGQKLFVMEFFPYHSAKFDRRLYEYTDDHPYRRFVVEMLKYAVKTGKTILLRSKSDYEKIGKELLGCNCTVSRNPRNVRLMKKFYSCFDLQ